MPTDTHGCVGYPIPWSNVTSSNADDPSPKAPGGFAASVKERRDLLIWVAIGLAGLALTGLAVRTGAHLGTASAPFLGRYRLSLGLATMLAPIVAGVVLFAAIRGRHNEAATPFSRVLAMSYGASFLWCGALALVDGAAGFTRSLRSANNYLTDVPAVGDDPAAYLRTFVAHAAEHSVAGRGHPPGPVLLLWWLHRLGLTDRLALGILVTAVGALLVPVVLAAVRGVCGEIPARRYAPVLILAPYAVWIAVSVDVVVAVLGAVAVLAAVHASDHRRSGLRAGGWAAVAGLLLGVAALFSYAAPWLGLSAVCLYFARRRAFLNLATGLGALVPIAAAHAAGFSWVSGLLAARADYETRVEPHRSVLWWSALSLVALVVAAGPALIASTRKVRRTPGWPFLVGAGAAVVFSLAAGLARGGVEVAWLPFFPWLTVAVVAPERQGGEPVATPLLLVAAGALAAVVIEAVLATPW
jgi:methylthioxylose transferase